MVITLTMFLNQILLRNVYKGNPYPLGNLLIWVGL
jgi:hypothetical protein